MSVPIVVDEWIFHDLLGENGPDQQYETYSFIGKLLIKCDKIVILLNSPFEVKMNEFLKRGSVEKDLIIPEMIKVFRNSIFMNLSKTVRLNLTELRPLEGLLTRIPEEDQYLFQAYLKLKNRGSFIVTTDKRWDRNAIKKVSIKYRDDFIPVYLDRKQETP
jgi:hypothetical protein